MARPRAHRSHVLGILLVLVTLAGYARADWAGHAAVVGAARYRIGQKIAAGSWGEIYSGHDGSGQHVAIKILKPNTPIHRSTLAIEHEVMSAAGGTHPTLPRSFGLGHVEGHAEQEALVQELMSGHILANPWIPKPTEPRPSGKSVRIIMQVLRATRALHNAGYRHNDLQPANILIDNESSESVRVIDFGHATKLGQTQREGFAGWVAPEQQGAGAIAGKVSAEMYTVGANLVTLLTGKHPQQVDIDREIPAPLRPIIRRAMDRDPAKRFQSSQEFLDALRPHSCGL